MSHGLLTTAHRVHPELISSKGGRTGSGVGSGVGGKNSLLTTAALCLCVAMVLSNGGAGEPLSSQLTSPRECEKQAVVWLFLGPYETKSIVHSLPTPVPPAASFNR